MHNFTKTLLTGLALTLGACDADDIDDIGDIGDETSEFRPGVGTFSMNTSFIGGHDYDELNLLGALRKGVRLNKVCLANANKTCLVLNTGSKGIAPDKLWVTASQLFGKKNDVTYQGIDFNKSRWYLDLDHNRDGVIDSTIQLVLDNAKPAKTVAPTPVVYWNYYWAYDSKTATGLITKYIVQSEAPTPMCEIDPDTGSLGSVLLEETTIDTSPTTKGLVEYAPNVMFVACHSGASGKAPGGFGYAMHDLGQKVYTNVIRLIRADYGNNGTSFTAPGQKLTVTDDLVINKQYDSGYKLEGLLSLDAGWLCIYQPRMVTQADVLAANPTVPICDSRAVVGDWFGGVLSNVMTQPVP